MRWPARRSSAAARGPRTRSTRVASRSWNGLGDSTLAGTSPACVRPVATIASARVTRSSAANSRTSPWRPVLSASAFQAAQLRASSRWRSRPAYWAVPPTSAESDKIWQKLLIELWHVGTVSTATNRVETTKVLVRCARDDGCHGSQSSYGRPQAGTCTISGRPQRLGDNHLRSAFLTLPRSSTAFGRWTSHRAMAVPCADGLESRCRPVTLVGGIESRGVGRPRRPVIFLGQ